MSTVDGTGPGDGRDPGWTPPAVTLPPEEWTAFHDLHWPGARWGGLDHVVVGPPGVFVVDSQVVAGDVTVHDGRLLHDGRPADDLLLGAIGAALAIGERLSTVDVTRVRPVLCLAIDQPLSGVAGGVLVCSTTSLAATLLAQPRALDADDCGLAAEELRALDRNDGLSPHEHAPMPEGGRRSWLGGRRRGAR